MDVKINAIVQVDIIGGEDPAARIKKYVSTAKQLRKVTNYLT